MAAGRSATLGLSSAGRTVTSMPFSIYPAKRSGYTIGTQENVSQRGINANTTAKEYGETPGCTTVIAAALTTWAENRRHKKGFVIRAKPGRIPDVSPR
ncbi:hypothetical protein Trydic_g7164 [Trypoxylus dichotomus]